LFPFVLEGGGIDWKNAMRLLRGREAQYPLLLELTEQPGMTNPLESVKEVFDGWRTNEHDSANHHRRSRGHAGEASRSPLAIQPAPLREDRVPILRDGYGLMQCVAVKAALPQELFETVRT